MDIVSDIRMLFRICYDASPYLLIKFPAIFSSQRALTLWGALMLSPLDSIRAHCKIKNKATLTDEAVMSMPFVKVITSARGNTEKVYF